jgi:hypothetical protein
MLRFESLNHAQDQGINGQTARPLLEGERTYGGHREIDAIDPKPTWNVMPAIGLSSAAPSRQSAPVWTRFMGPDGTWTQKIKAETIHFDQRTGNGSPPEDLQR